MKHLFHRKDNNFPNTRKLEDTDLIDSDNEDYPSDTEYLLSDTTFITEALTDAPTNTLIIYSKILSINLLQVQFNDDDLNLYLYFFSREIIPDDMELKIKIVIDSINSNNLEESKKIETFKAIKIKNIINNNNEISCYTIDDVKYNTLINTYEEGNIKIIVNKIELNNKEYQINNQKYILNVNLGDNGESQKKHNINFQKVLSENPNYNIRTYEIQEISSCSNELKFNLTVDREIKESNSEITLVFNQNFQDSNLGRRKNKGGNNKEINRDSIPKTINFTSMNVTALCNLSSKYNNIIPCKTEEETRNLNYTMNDYLFYDENHLIFIYYNESNISLYCYEKPPIAAIIFIAAIFFFIVIVVIIIIIFINKKGRGNNGYEIPNNGNSNNALGLSSMGIAK